jgi:hypothetical protein
MNGQTSNKGIAAIFTVALVAALFVGGIGGYAAAKAEGTGVGPVQQVSAIASRWDHEERMVDTSVQRASRWDHEERTAGSTIQRASRWDHEER